MSALLQHDSWVLSPQDAMAEAVVVLAGMGDKAPMLPVPALPPPRSPGGPLARIVRQPPMAPGQGPCGAAATQAARARVRTLEKCILAGICEVGIY